MGEESVSSRNGRIEDLREFVENKMSMTANYQPVILRELLLRGGVATKEQLTHALMKED